MRDDEALDWRDLEAELHRPIPAARRVQLEVSWREGPAWAYRRKVPDQMTDNELFDVLERLANEAEARAAGLSWRTVERAKATLGIRAERHGEPGRRGGGTWYWTLPGLRPPEHYIENVAVLMPSESEEGSATADSGGLNGDAEEVLF